MFVGIDVAKAELVVAIRPTNDQWTVANDERGVRAPGGAATRRLAEPDCD